MEHILKAGKSILSVRFIIVERNCLLDIHDRIDPEAAKPFIQPPVDVLIDFFTKLRILPVEIWLFLVEYMQILFVGSRQILPGRTAEVGTPVGGKFPFLLISQIEEIAVFPVRILAGFLEPFMLVGAVIYHQIHQYVHISLLRFCDQPVHVFHGAEAGIDRIVI